jgi:hypothetical protein
MSVTSGFLVVKRFEALYRAFATDPKFDWDVYALPLFGTSPERPTVRYRGLDREPLTPFAKGSLAQVRMLELKGKEIDGTEDFLTTEKQAIDVLGWTKEETPEQYEIVWAKISDRLDRPPSMFERLGFEPTYFTGDHFSAICDCMCFPRWHGTDREGTLFRSHFDRLNSNGLFDDPRTAADFLAYYLSIDWTERGEYEIAEVWAPVVA